MDAGGWSDQQCFGKPYPAKLAANALYFTTY
jgi:hypothetical protein